MLIVSEVVPDATSVIVYEASKNVVVTAPAGADRIGAQDWKPLMPARRTWWLRVDARTAMLQAGEKSLL